MRQVRSLDFMQAKDEDKKMHGRGPLIVQLVASAPHDMPDSEPVSEWWGRNIIVSQPLKPRRHHVCNPMYVYRILGPPAFVDLLASLGRYERFACEHCIEWINE